MVDEAGDGLGVGVGVEVFDEGELQAVSRARPAVTAAARRMGGGQSVQAQLARTASVTSARSPAETLELKENVTTKVWPLADG